MKEQVWGTATLSSRGQITVPKDVRDALLLHEGDVIEFRVKDGEVLLALARAVPDPLEKWVGAFPFDAGPGGTVGWVRELRGWDREQTEF